MLTLNHQSWPYSPVGIVSRKCTRPLVFQTNCQLCQFGRSPPRWLRKSNQGIHVPSPCAFLYLFRSYLCLPSLLLLLLLFSWTAAGRWWRKSLQMPTTPESILLRSAGNMACYVGIQWLVHGYLIDGHVLYLLNKIWYRRQLSPPWAACFAIFSPVRSLSLLIAQYPSFHLASLTTYELIPKQKCGSHPCTQTCGVRRFYCRAESPPGKLLLLLFCSDLP